MTEFHPIDFHQTRDFSSKMNATFEFIRQNFKGLFKSILFIAGPPILLASLLMGSFVGEMFNPAMLASPDQIRDLFLTPNFWMQMGLMFVFLMVSGVSTIASINSYIILYGEKKSNDIQVSEVWERVRSNFWMYLGTMVLFFIMMIVIYIVSALPMLLLIAISPWLSFFGIIIFVCALMYLLVSCSLIFIIRGYERIGFIEATVRSFQLIQGKWWSTFGLIMILYMIIMIVSYMLIIFWSVISMTSSLHDLDTNNVEQMSSTLQTFSVVFFAVYYLIQMVLYSLPNIGIAFQYFNLVERKEAKMLINQIQTIGDSSQAAATPDDEHY